MKEKGTIKHKYKLLSNIKNCVKVDNNKNVTFNIFNTNYFTKEFFFFVKSCYISKTYQIWHKSNITWLMPIFSGSLIYLALVVYVIKLKMSTILLIKLMLNTMYHNIKKSKSCLENNNEWKVTTITQWKIE